MDKRPAEPPRLGIGNILFIAALLLLVYSIYTSYTRAFSEVAYGQLLEEVNKDNIDSITISDSGEISGKFKTPSNGGISNFVSYVVPGLIVELNKILEEKKIKPAYERQGMGIGQLLMTFLPIALLVIIVLIASRGMGGGMSRGMNPLQYGKSKIKIDQGKNKITFRDVAGIKEAKHELEEIVDFLKNPMKFTNLGGRIPKGVLLVGAPGTGKTLLAKAVAGEANVPFFSTSGSEFVELFVGVGASRVRDLFETGKRNAPCIIFIDEIDAIGGSRTSMPGGGGHEEREQTLNQILSEMDGFEANDGVIIIAATNRPDTLDKALLRPGRFDRRVVVDRPDVNGRLEILMVHSAKIVLNNPDDLKIVARGTPGFVGADLANLLNEAALLASSRNKDRIFLQDLEDAKDKVLMGSERRSLIISDKEKETTAYHEAGHAILAACLPDADPIHKVTIIPRGMSMGSTWQLPDDDKHNYSKAQLKTQLAILMGGRAAEEIFLNQFTTGASNDIERASKLSHRMVCEWGMSELGPINFGDRPPETFVGRNSLEEIRNYSEKTAREIDSEIKKLIDEAYNCAKKELKENREKVKKVAELLRVKEIIDGEEIINIMKES